MTDTDLPVPVGPQTSGLNPWVSKVRHMYDSWAVQAVGTIIVLNSASSGIVNLARVWTQLTHLPFLGS